jgi:hypothetical protein
MLPGDLKEAFLAAVRRLMRPVVRQLLAHGVTHPAFSEMLREIYVEVAERDLALPHKRQTDSRVSLVTGLHRKEVARLRHAPPEERAPRALERSAVTRVLGRWMAGAPWADRQHRPRTLPYEASGTRPSFARLVREVAVDAPPRSVLDELLYLGIVELTADNEVELRREVHVPLGDAAAKLELLGSDPGELFATIMHNVEHPDEPRLQRKVVYDNVGSDALAELRAAARRVGESFIREANALLAARDRDRNADAPGGARTRVALGAYYFEEELEPGQTATRGDAGPARRLPGRLTRSR